MRCYFAILALFAFFCLSNSLIGQNRKYYNSLKKDKQNTIEYSKEILNSLEKDSKSTLDKIFVVREEIAKRREVLYIIKKEIQLINEEIATDEIRLKELTVYLDDLKKEYAKLIYFASLNMSVQRRMIYILSAESFNNAYKRIIYLKQLSDFRKERSQKISTSIRAVDSTLVTLNELKLTKEYLINEEQSELERLKQVRHKATSILSTTNAQIAQINYQLKKEQKSQRVIKKEVTKEITVEEKKKNSNVTKKSIKLEGNITKKFRGKKRWHIWPLEKSVVLHRFGDYYHPKLKHVVVKNDGIVLGAKPKSNVHSIFEGKVVNAISIPGDGYSIIIKHGDFYSVYSKVENVMVKAGQIVSRGEVIARMRDTGSMPKMNFQLWYKKQKLNPTLWLKKR